MPIRVAIVGGGPSGWSAAEALRAADSRFEPTVFERNAYFGGKCCTVDASGEVTNGTPGGYELGAGVLSHGSESNAHLEALLARYGLAHRDAAEAERTKYRFYSGGQPLTAGRLLGLALRHPLQALGLLVDTARYVARLRRYSPTPSLGYAERPEALTAPFSATYGRAFLTLCSFGMQGFGYADRSDAQLAPAELYYHQYAPLDVIVNPVHVLVSGMQGTWATVAASYPTSQARLNAEVTRIERDADGVWVTANGARERFDYLVLAMPLRPTLPFLDATEAEAALLSRVQVNHYVTVHCRAEGLVDIAHVDLDATADRDRYGELVFAYKRYPDSDWITVNLFEDPAALRSDDELLAQVQEQLQRQLGAKMLAPETARVTRWRDYFPHLRPEDLQEGWYARFESEVQGQRRTLWVSSGLHMETVGASVKYATLTTSAIAKEWLSTFESHNS